MHQIPEDFARRMRAIYGDQGTAWLTALPAILDEIAQRWQLQLLPPFQLSFNYVAPTVRADGQEAVLKLGMPHRELLSEIYALQIFDGRGAVKLLEADFERQIFLLERVRPGVELVTVKDDEQATRIAAQVMRQYWCSVKDNLPLLTVESWTAGFQKLRPHFNGTTGPFAVELVEAAESIFAEYVPSQGERVLLHGDLHHWNILSATRQPWLAIDPKGVIGEREYDTGALLRNPWGQAFPNATELKRLQARRVDIFAEMLGFERERIIGWGMAQAMLSAWWCVEDEGSGWESAVAYAEALYALMRKSG